MKNNGVKSRPALDDLIHTKYSFPEFIAECQDALQGYKRCTPLDEHLDVTGNLLEDSTISVEKRVMLESIDTSFREINQCNDPIHFALSPEPLSIRPALDNINKFLNDVDYKHCVFHGTIRGKLKSIFENGLIPAYKPVWKGKDLEHVREHSSDAVFFCRTWRNAYGWAESAQAVSRGPKNGWYRTPIIIRVPGQELTLESDNLAMQPNCLLVRRQVKIENADVLVMPCTGIPNWLPIKDAS